MLFYHIILYCIILYRIILYYTILYYIILYYIILYWWDGRRTCRKNVPHDIAFLTGRMDLFEPSAVFDLRMSRLKGGTCRTCCGWQVASGNWQSIAVLMSNVKHSVGGLEISGWGLFQLQCGKGGKWDGHGQFQKSTGFTAFRTDIQYVDMYMYIYIYDNSVRIMWGRDSTSKRRKWLARDGRE